jgi:hypothetical protein
MSSKEVARYLNIPIMSVGQLVYENILLPIGYDNFLLEDIEHIRNRVNLDDYRVK